MGIRHWSDGARSPRQNGHFDGLIGSIRRDCFDHVIVFGEAHLRRVLKAYASYYSIIDRPSGDCACGTQASADDCGGTRSARTPMQINSASMPPGAALTSSAPRPRSGLCAHSLAGQIATTLEELTLKRKNF
jgi:hypothetical protein